MLADYLLILIGLIALIIASYTDIKTREVPDWLNYSLIIIALVIRLFSAIIYSIWPYFLYGLLAFFIMFIVGNIMYYTRLWGGGDTKLLMAIGVLFATSPFYLPEENLFLLKLFINILIIGALYGIIWSTILAIKNKEKFIPELNMLFQKYKKTRKYIYLASLILIIIAILIPNIRIILLLIISFLIIQNYIWIIIKTIENISMYKKISITKLTEGDWIADEKIRKEFNISRLGIEQQQINSLKKSKIKTVLIKEGIPFIPSFLIAVILTLINGKILLII